MSKFLLRSALVVAVVGAAASVLAADISGAGATFPYPIYSNGPTPTKGHRQSA